jgi:hypothetical protein
MVDDKEIISFSDSVSDDYITFYASVTASVISFRNLSRRK